MLKSLTEKQLLVIDGYGFIFRAYHAAPPLTSPQGDPVGALYGFTSMLLKILADFSPSNAVIALDSGGITFRHKIYSLYKANRPEVDQDLKFQLALLEECAHALNFATIKQSGVEADDIIATICAISENSNIPTVIISSDKDLLQLMSTNTLIYDPIKNRYITEQDVLEKFGTKPYKIPEVQALIGDKSDNIPGVVGIGPKIAAELIAEFDTVANLLNNMDAVTKPRYQNMLRQGAQDAIMSRELVKLRNDVELNKTIADFAWTTPEASNIIGFLQKYGFKSLIKRAENIFKLDPLIYTKNNEEQSAQNKPNIIQKLEIAELNNPTLLAELKQILQSKAVVNIYCEAPLIYIAIGNFVLCYDKAQIYQLEEMLGNIFLAPEIKKITYDLKSLQHLMDRKILGIEDLQLMDYAISAGTKTKNLQEIISLYLNYNFEAQDVQYLCYYMQDAYNELSQHLHKHSALALYYCIDLPICQVLFGLEKNGVSIDTEYLVNLSQEFAAQIKSLEEEIFLFTNEKFNLSSPKQLGEILFSKLKLPFGKMSPKSNHFITNADVLEHLSNEGYIIADLILHHRQISKLQNTYTDSLITLVNPATHRIHTSFLQNSTSTGRLSSRDPNVQNIPIRTKQGNKIRKAFIAANGHKLISADYSQIELRILSDIADITPLKEAFHNKKDIHTQTASQIFSVPEDQVSSSLRRQAKAINFGIIYGISAFGLAKQLSITNSEASQYMERYFKEYPGIKEYMQSTIEFARIHGYVQNKIGRKCFVPDINNKNYNLRSFAERAAINAPIQGLNADIIKIAMININKLLASNKLETIMIMQIHDELIFEAPDNEIESVSALIKSAMENAYSLSVPIIVDIKLGTNWQEMV